MEKKVRFILAVMLLMGLTITAISQGMQVYIILAMVCTMLATVCNIVDSLGK